MLANKGVAKLSLNLLTRYPKSIQNRKTNTGILVQRGKNLGELKIIGMSPTVVAGEVIEGEFEVYWDKSNPEDIRKAEEVFLEYVQKGWLATGEIDGGKKQIFSFDPKLEKIVLFPVILGG